MPAVVRVWLPILLLAAVPLKAQDLSREDELGALRVQINRLQSRLARLDHERRGLESDLARIGLELELQEARVAEAETERISAQAELSRLEESAGLLETELEEARRALRGVLVRLYRSGDQGHLRLLVSVETGDGLLEGMRQLRFLARRDAKALRHYVHTFEELDRRREEAHEKASEIEAWLARERERSQELDDLRGRQRAILARLEGERREVAAQTTRLVEREGKLADLVEMLAAGAPATPGGDPVTRFRGVLDWPVAGRVTRGFGPRSDPRYGTKVPHNGLELSTGEGASVRTVFPGTVLFAGPFEGYGLTAIVLHPGRVFTIYAGLRELRVAKDDMVSLGHVLGTVSGSLYFEIRHENRPEDPRLWLR
jgi:septal ring factor EnvC (AmiA/AmiB activator)